MKIIYFEANLGQKRLAAMVTNDSIESLKARGAIEKESPTLVVNVNADVNTATAEDEE